jgi:sugar/nucleoside kinase (ribokinase family)
MSPAAVLDLLKQKGCKIGGVTQGERGILWYDEKGTVQTMPALKVPAREIVDTNGAGDVFHGAYVYSYLAHPELSWDAHFRFARAASAHAIRFLGNEARLPSFADVEAAERRFKPLAAITA